MWSALIAIVAVILAIVIIVDLAEIINKKNEERMYAEEIAARDKQNKEREISKQQENSFRNDLDAFIDTFGACTADVQIGSRKTSIEDHLLIFEDSSTIVLNAEVIPFSKVLGFTLYDDKQTLIKNDTVYQSTTKTSTGSMIGRAAVGGILLGGVGALAGAATAKTETTTTPVSGGSTTTTSHIYKLFINIDDLSQPTRVIHIGASTEKAQHVVNIFNIIIKRNQNNEA